MIFYQLLYNLHVATILKDCVVLTFHILQLSKISWHDREITLGEAGTKI